MTQHVDDTSINLQNENLQKLKSVFPNFVKDGYIDFDGLKAFFDAEGINVKGETYGLNWSGKKQAFEAIQVPATGTLTLDEEESKNLDTTQNIFIEGDNLEVLKLLQKKYTESIKMIYIDPPYNTGKDFVYTDNFKENRSDYYERTGQTKDGVKLVTNPESNGRFHSDWLTMMYPRLFLARNLLKEDGVIFVSIDDHEVHNLRLIMDEIFGEENFVGCLNVKTATDNNKTLVSTEHEYILVYSKNKLIHTFWERRSESADLIMNKYNELKELYGSDIEKIQTELRKWIKVNKKVLEKTSHYDNVDEKGVYHDGDIANTRFGGYIFDVIHPITKKPCKIPDKGFRYPEETLLGMIKQNNIVFGDDENTLIKPKKRLEDVREILRSYIYEDGRTSTKAFENLMGRGIFDNPKSHFILARLIDFVSEKESLILDFFAGSGTTAHAVMELNAEDGGQRKCISVQLPELTEDKSEAYKAGYTTISQITRERIRRAGEKILVDFAEKLKERETPLDIGFKAFRLEHSNYRKWNTLTEENTEEDIKAQLDLFAQKPLIDGYNENSVVYEILLKEGMSLLSSVHFDNEKKLWHITDDTKSLVISFAKSLSNEQIETFGLKKDDIFVCFDSALTDSLKINLEKNREIRVV